MSSAQARTDSEQLFNLGDAAIEVAGRVNEVVPVRAKLRQWHGFGGTFSRFGTRWQAERVSPSDARDFHAAERSLLREAVLASMTKVRAAACIPSNIARTSCGGDGSSVAARTDSSFVNNGSRQYSTVSGASPKLDSTAAAAASKSRAAVAPSIM